MGMSNPNPVIFSTIICVCRGYMLYAIAHYELSGTLRVETYNMSSEKKYGARTERSQRGEQFKE